jgi:molybdopterin molybdotransferase
MLTVDEALRKVLDRAETLPPSMVPVRQALGLVLAEDVTSDVDSPPHDKSIVDGYAIVADDLARGLTEFDVIEEVTAGSVPTRTLAPGQATRIMTGAPVPSGATAVVMVERTEVVRTGPMPLGRVRITERQATSGQNIMPRAASLTRGAVVVRRGCEIRPIEIGLLSEVGRSEVSAYARPSIAVLPTGNEVVSVAEVPGPGQIRNSNGPMLLAAAQRAGATTFDLGVGRDNKESLQRLVARGLRCDVLVVSGGVSAGLLDLVPEVLADAGVAQVFHKISLKPGKPLWFGTLAGSQAPGGGNKKLVFGLPGNPVSSLVCFELFVRPAIGRLAGRMDAGLRRLPARLAAEYVHRGDRPTYHPARLEGREPAAVVEPLAWRGSGDLASLASANALAHFPSGDRTFAAGEIVEALVL